MRRARTVAIEILLCWVSNGNGKDMEFVRRMRLEITELLFRTRGKWMDMKDSKMWRTNVAVIGILLCWMSVLCCFCFGIAAAEHESWDCPECGRTGNTKNYCGGCGYPASWIEDTSLKLLRDEFSQVGNIVRFGHYEQDNELDNGQEEIEWIVLDVQDGKSLLLSKYGLDSKPYNAINTNITWEICTVRNWLNYVFLKAAFTVEEQSAILTTNVDNSKSQGYGGYDTNGGDNTQDRIFLLSNHEVFDLYLKNDGAVKCVPTKYAKAQDAYVSSSYKADGQAAGWWWLRSPGYDQRSAMTVGGGGTRSNRDVNRDSGCVRPAIWINLESEIIGNADASNDFWDCPNCGRKRIIDNYCGHCGHLAPWMEMGTEKPSNKVF